MRLATIRTPAGPRAVHIDGNSAIECGPPDVGAPLAEQDWRTRAALAQGPRRLIDDLDYAPLVPRPGKIIGAGLNYRSHIQEMRRDLLLYPTLFARFPEVLLGQYDDLVLPAESQAVDWEAELAIVIGSRTRPADESAACSALAGYTIVNDISMRDRRFQTREWLQGTIFEATAPFGPHLVTPDAIISCRIDGELLRESTIRSAVRPHYARRLHLHDHHPQSRRCDRHRHDRRRRSCPGTGAIPTTRADAGDEHRGNRPGRHTDSRNDGWCHEFDSARQESPRFPPRRPPHRTHQLTPHQPHGVGR